MANSVERFNHHMEVLEGMLDLNKIPAPRNRDTWTPVEIDILVDWVYNQGVNDWPGCAGAIGTKTPEQCRYKYRNMREKTRMRNGEKPPCRKPIKRTRPDDDKDNACGTVPSA